MKYLKASAAIAYIALLATFGSPALSDSGGQKNKFKILYVMSYHSPWRWTDGQFDGFKDGLNSADAEYRVFQMDTKRHSERQWKEAMLPTAKGAPVVSLARAKKLALLSSEVIEHFDWEGAKGPSL